jgi:hypothetical protein
MTSITGLTAARMLAIEGASIVDGEIVGEDLILTKHDASTTNAGSVKFDIPIVTALPGSPSDGDEVYLQTSAMAAANLIWHLRYRAAAGTYKWEYLGGSPFITGVSGDITTTSSSRVAMTSGPTVVLPLAGKYILSLDVTVVGAATPGTALHGIRLDSGAAPITNCEWSSQVAGQMYTGGQALATTAAGTLGVLVKNANSFSTRWVGATITARPIAVG